MKLWTGGYTARSDGNATGIGVLLAGDPDDGSAGGQLAFAGDAVGTEGSPSWVSIHPALDVVYAAMEDAGTVRAFQRTGEASFAPLGGPIEAGSAVCHVAVAPDGGSLVASCWNDGRVVRMRLDAAGMPSAPVIAAAAADPYGPDAAPSDLLGAVDLRPRADTRGAGEFSGAADLADAARALRAAAGAEFAHLIPEHEAPDSGKEDSGEPALKDAASRVSRAHQAIFLPNGLVATTDMGLDLVRFWRATPDGLRPVQQVALPRGSGPRHMVWHPSGHLYVVAELSCEVFALAAEASGAWRIVTAAVLGAQTLP
ncbi:MAG: beta-propeller fold lactonase family protein, partial [Microbacterium pygmaeum]